MNLLAQTAELSRREFEFARMPVGWTAFFALVGVVLLCYVAFWLYRRESRAGAGRRLRAVLAGIRSLVIVGLALIWLEPVIATYKITTRPARVAIVCDVSDSMTIADSDAAPTTRRQRVERLLTHEDAAWLRALQEKNDVALYAFGDGLHRLPWSPASSSGELLNAPAGLRSRTDLGQALLDVMDELSDAPIAAIVVISDGAINRGLEAEAIAAQARQRRAPVYTIGIGSPTEPPNVRIAGVAAPALVPLGDPFELRVEMAAGGIDAADIEVELFQQRASDDDAGGAPPIATKILSIAAETPIEPLTFSLNPTAPGEFVYRTRVRPLDSEAILEDNERDVHVQIVDERFKVLIVSGRPSYEYRFITSLFERDKTIDLSCWLQSADENAVRDGNTIILELPRRPEQVLAYDAIFLLDPNPADLDQPWALILRRFVDEFGGGLLFQAGQHFSPRFLKDERLADLTAILPIAPDPEADVRMSDLGAYRTVASAFDVPQENASHPLVSFAGDAGVNARVWRALPGAWWSLPVLREKPVAAVLLRNSGASQRPALQSDILMAVHPVGAGRCAFLGFDSTWRWRSTAEGHFNRFWVQMVRYLAQARREGVSKRGTLTLDRDSVSVGDYVKIEARVLDETFAASTAPQVEVGLDFADGSQRSTALQAIPGREGWFAGRVLFDVPGAATIRLPLPGGTAGEEAVSKRVRVQPPDVEMRSLRLREDILQQIAEQSGGEYLPFAQAGALSSKIADARQTTISRDPNPLSLWDKTWVLGILAAFLTVEWALRRRNHLL